MMRRADPGCGRSCKINSGMRQREQLERIQTELADARGRAHEIAVSLENAEWAARPAANQWSVAECLIHLNMTSRAFLPLINDALGRGRERELFRSAPYRLDFMGWLLWWAATVRLPIKTTEPFVPDRGQPRDVSLSEFDGLQEQLIGCLKEAEGLDLAKLRVVSPFDSRIKYNLYSCLRLIPAHQRQHLRQAEQVVRKLGRTKAGP
jgi:DinB family protein